MDESNDLNDFCNGLLFDSLPCVIPREILAYILSFVDPASLVFQCRRVCKSWKDIIDNDVWKILILFKNVKSLTNFSHLEKMQLRLPWHVYYTIFTHDPFNRNLIQNNCEQNESTYYSSRMGNFEICELETPNSYPHFHLPGNQRVVELQPYLAQALPKNEDFEGQECCFTTRFVGNKKSQVINLKKFGISDKFMDEFQPVITASEWYAWEYGFRCIYQLKVKLLGEDGSVIANRCSQQARILEQELSEWDKVEFTFSNYGPGVRYVKFQHNSVYNELTEDFFYLKTAGAVVKVSLPI